MCGKGCLFKPMLDCLGHCCDNSGPFTMAICSLWASDMVFMDINITELVPCTFFFFNTQFYIPVKLKHLSGHMHMSKLENAILQNRCLIISHFLWDTIHFEWHSIHVHMNGQPVNLPSSFTIPLKGKIRARQMLAKEDLDLQFMFKQGSN